MAATLCLALDEDSGREQEDVGMLQAAPKRWGEPPVSPLSRQRSSGFSERLSRSISAQTAGQDGR